MSTTNPREPISWLRLEQYYLGELDPKERAAVEEGLRASAADRACLHQIAAGDQSLLPPLPVPLPHRAQPAKQPRQWTWLPPLRYLGMGLVAASALWAVFEVGGPFQDVPRPNANAVKGGNGDSMSIVLIRERAGQTDPQPETYQRGDRFKIRLSCVSEQPMLWRVIVRQHNETFQPLVAAKPIACGNQVSLPGAFQITGTAPAQVCVELKDSAGDLGGPDQQRCITLHAVQ